MKIDKDRLPYLHVNICICTYTCIRVCVCVGQGSATLFLVRLISP